MNKEQIVSLFIVSAFTSLILSDTMFFVLNIVIFFTVLVYFVWDDDEFDED